MQLNQNSIYGRSIRGNRTDSNYERYKVALGTATLENRKSKLIFERNLATNIKNDSKSFFAYVRSKQEI